MSSLDHLHLDASCVLTDDTGMAPYLTDWRGRYRGVAHAVLRPRSVEDVAIIMRWASATGTAVVPQGGNTGLSGGATPDMGGSSVVLSLGRMNRIRAVDVAGSTMVAEAGCVLSDMQQAAGLHNRQFPMSLGSEGSCQLGGLIAANAGGINVIRYGTMRDLVLGLEYVTADGRIVHGLKQLRKNNAGYDIRSLLIGSEGTLAIITAAVVKLVAQVNHSVTCVCGLPSPEMAIVLLERLRDIFGERISSFELMCDGEMELTLNLVSGCRFPLAARHPWYVFVEVADGNCADVLGDRLENAIAAAIEQDIVRDAVMARSDAQARALWHLRFAVSEANRLSGPNVSHDTSVPVAEVPPFIAAVKRELPVDFPDCTPLFVGHVGDGNIHVIVSFPSQTGPVLTDDTASAVNDRVFEIVHRFKGSITAEHGVGQALRRQLATSADATALNLMRGIKAVFDPAGILNPGKVL